MFTDKHSLFVLCNLSCVLYNKIPITPEYLFEISTPNQHNQHFLCAMTYTLEFFINLYKSNISNLGSSAYELTNAQLIIVNHFNYQYAFLRNFVKVARIIIERLCECQIVG